MMFIKRCVCVVTTYFMYMEVNIPGRFEMAPGFQAWVYQLDPQLGGGGGGWVVPGCYLVHLK